MHVFVIFLAWAVVSGATAWSSGEVQCGSCGSECQKACGTRNFRVCCFLFQRRRRSQAAAYSLKDGSETESLEEVADNRSYLKPLWLGHENQAIPLFRSSPKYEEPLLRPAQDSLLLSPLLLDYMQDSRGLEDEEEEGNGGNLGLQESPRGVPRGRGTASLKESAGVLGSLKENAGDDEENEALTRLVDLIYRHPEVSNAIHRARYPTSKIRK